IDAGRDLREADSARGSHLHRDASISERPVAELPVAVVAPGPYLAAGGKCQAVTRARRDRSEADPDWHLDWRGDDAAAHRRAAASRGHAHVDGNIRARGGPVTELAKAVGPPCHSR